MGIPGGIMEIDIVKFIQEWITKSEEHFQAVSVQQHEAIGAIKILRALLQDLDARTKEEAVAQRHGKKPKTASKVTSSKK